MEEIAPLEAAIPPHLTGERTQPLRVPSDFQGPTIPACSARFSEQTAKMATVDFGIQAKPGIDISKAVQRLTAAFKAAQGPGHIIPSSLRDPKGFDNMVFTTYWADAEEYDKWQQSLGKGWWYAHLEPAGEIGVFIESYIISVDEIETLFSRPKPHGFAAVAKSMSGPTDTHGYSGSMRDRIPCAQTDPLEPGVYPSVARRPAVSKGAHIVVRPQDNLCIIRSGQDWGDCDEEETSWYISQMQPRLKDAMDHIVQHQSLVGCFSSRLMQVGHHGVENITETWNIGAWSSLGQLEAWTEFPIHKRLMDAAKAYGKKFGDQGKFLLWHEVMVVKEGNQLFEYYNCHEETGLLSCVYN